MRHELHDETIRIRKYRSEDVPLLYEAARESIGESFTRWMPWCHAAYTIEESRSFIESRFKVWRNGQDYDFAVIDLATEEFLGAVGVNQFNRTQGFANLGYWVRTSRWGRGIAPAAARLAAQFAFEDLKLQRVEIVVPVDNLRSQRVAEKAGATREGVLRNRLLIAGQMHDAVIHSLLPDDLKRT